MPRIRITETSPITMSLCDDHGQWECPLATLKQVAPVNWHLSAQNCHVWTENGKVIGLEIDLVTQPAPSVSP